MADVIHTHGAPKCRIGKHNAACPANGWSFVCGPARNGRHTCIHLDPSTAGSARMVRAMKALGLKVMKGMKRPAKKRKR